MSNTSLSSVAVDLVRYLMLRDRPADIEMNRTGCHVEAVVARISKEFRVASSFAASSHKLFGDDWSSWGSTLA